MSPVQDLAGTRQRCARPSATTRVLARAGSVLVVGALGVAGLALPASAETQSFGSATLTGPDTVVTGQTIHVEGDGFTASDGAGSVLGIKLDDSDLSPKAGATVPGASATRDDLWAAVQADTDGGWEADLPFPTAANTEAADGFQAGSWAAGTQHTLRVLTGSLKPGDTPRTVAVKFEVVAAPTEATVAVTAANGGRGADAAQVTLTVSGQAFDAAGAVPTVQVDGADATWSTVPKIADDGTFSGGKIVFAPGTIRAGKHEVAVAQGDATATADVTVVPALTWSSLTAGSDGTLTLANLPSGATVKSISLGDVVFAAAGAVNAAGTSTVAYAIPATATLGTQQVTVTLADGQTFTSSAKVSPSSATFGEDGFTVVTSPATIEQGLYQTAYSAANDDLFATSANSTSTSTIYKLNPRTLKVRNSVVPAYVDGTSGPLYAAYGIGVDDHNNTVWVTETRQNSIAVYDQDDLSLVKQFPAGEISHARDVVYDPATNHVFVSSASEGSSGDGYVNVYDGTTLELVKQVGTGARSEFSPVSLDLDAKTGTVFVTSLTTSRLGTIDTKTLAFGSVALEGLPDGAKASGVAVDSADGRVFVASQNVDGLLVADAATGKKIATVPTGAGALNVAYDPVHHLVYVANFGGTSVSVADADGNLVANLPFVRPNHVQEDGKGSVFAVNKDTDNTILRLTPKAVVGHAPTVSGTAKVGSTLTAKAGVWSEGSTLAYQWKRDGKAISGATKVSYTAVAADKGTKLTVTVTGSLAGYAATSETSSAATVAAGTLTAATPTVSGTAQVGTKLTAKAGTWTTGTTLKYQWKRNGATIKGATSASYTAVASDRGTKLTVTVTGSLSGYTAVAKTSKATAAVKAGTLTAATPTVSGTAQVGKKLTAKAGAWTKGATLKYQWKRNGATIKGATKSAYTATASDKGKKLTVTVTGALPGYTTVAKTSKATAAVKTGKLAAATPKVTGTAKVGKKLTAKAGAWTKGTALTYRWYANGKAIKGASGKTLKLAKAQQGKKITVKVTGKKSGYTTVTKTSKATKKVVKK